MGYLLLILYTYIFVYNHNIVAASTNNTNCSVYSELFAEAASDFTFCAISHSRPIKLCEECVDPYIRVLNSYDNLSSISNKGSPCIQSYINLDRLQIVQTLYRNSFDLWNRAKCYECFQIVDGILTSNLSLETTNFNIFYEKTWDCIKGTGANETDLCPTCLGSYLQLNDYYISISNENEKIGVCMDIVDQMNSTRSFWSDKCCKFRHHNEYIFLGSAAFMFVLTVLFYILAQLCVDKKAPAVFQQSRFAESLNPFQPLH